MDQHKKKLLILGGETKDIVEVAQQMGLYVIVASNQDKGSGKEIADEKLMLSTTDLDALETYIRKNNVSGVFAGPSEFHLYNVMQLCKRAGLPFYATEEQWETCSNKQLFKELCRKHDVPCVPEYKLTSDFLEEDLEKIEYPVIVKPVDSCSSKGLTVCHNNEDLKQAYSYALENSESNKVIIEKYINNGGYVASSRYIASNGQIHLSLVGDRYVVDGDTLITAFHVFPSKQTEIYLEEVNPKVIRMYESLGINNASFFMQAVPEDDFYFHEMGLRLSGGLTYTITEQVCGINDLKMLIRFAVGDNFSTAEELKNVDPYLCGKYAGILSIPLLVGTIGSIDGLDLILKCNNTIDLQQYYKVGDIIRVDFIGTRLQLFGSFKFVADSAQDIVRIINHIQSLLRVKDVEGNNMIYRCFDTNRLSEIK